MAITNLSESETLKMATAVCAESLENPKHPTVEPSR
jgi:hypothetical protein